jgi:hypothetical protein
LFADDIILGLRSPLQGIVQEIIGMLCSGVFRLTVRRLATVQQIVSSKLSAAAAVAALCGVLISCGSSNKVSTGSQPAPNIAGSWEFIATSQSGTMTGIETALTEGQVLENGLEVPNGQIAASGSQIDFITLTTTDGNVNISSFSDGCGATPTTVNNLSGAVSGLGNPITFTFTANGNVFNATATLSSDGTSITNGTYTPQGTTACDQNGGTIIGTAVTAATGTYQGQMCSPAESSCSSYDDSVTATITAKSGQLTLGLVLTGKDNTNFSPVGPLAGNAFSVEGTFEGNAVTYYGYFEAVYSSTQQTTAQAVYLINSADPCFSNPQTSCTTATVLFVPPNP